MSIIQNITVLLPKLHLVLVLDKLNSLNKNKYIHLVMSYNIEISFNILKQCSVDKTQNYVIDMARKYYCNFYYVDYEMENEYKYSRSHCVITVNFEESETQQIIDFLKDIKMDKTFYIESMYHDITNNYIYASKSYRVQNTNKSFTKEYYLNKKNKKYSEQEKNILKIIENKSNKSSKSNQKL